MRYRGLNRHNERLGITGLDEHTGSNIGWGTGNETGEFDRKSS